MLFLEKIKPKNHREAGQIHVQTLEDSKLQSLERGLFSIDKFLHTK